MILEKYKNRFKFFDIMIEQHFIVDESIPFIISDQHELDQRIASLLSTGAVISRLRPQHNVEPVNTYRISGEDFVAIVNTYPSGWDAHTPLGSDRRMVRVAFKSGDYEQFYGKIIEFLGIFDKVATEIGATYGVNARVLPIFDSSRAAAVLIDRKPYTPFKVNPKGGDATFPAYGIFVSTSREMKMFRDALRTDNPSGRLLDVVAQKIH